MPTQPAPPLRASGPQPSRTPGPQPSRTPGPQRLRALGEVDACPGALRLHAAADGPLARIRVPGGMLTGAQLLAVQELAGTWGDGHVELTSRANLQLRGLTDAPAEELAARLGAAGLLPSQTHELVRNIAASPMPGVLDVGPLVAELDRGLCADPRLAELPGRFLFALDSGDGDVAGSADVAALRVPSPPAPGRPPIGPPSSAPPSSGPLSPGTVLSGPTSPGSAEDEIAILFGGVDAGLRVPRTGVVAALLAAANAFLDERTTQASAAPIPATENPTTPTPTPTTQALGTPALGTPALITQVPGTQVPGTQAPVDNSGAGGAGAAWRLRELVDGPARVARRTAASLGLRLGEPTPIPAPDKRDPIGILAQPDGLFAVGALVPLGRLSAVHLTVLARAGRLVVTPWRGIVVPDLPPSAAESWLRALADAGLEVATGSRWTGVTTCAGRPGCARALADVRRDATATVQAESAQRPPGATATLQAESAQRPPGAAGGRELPVHWVGCGRGCGSPAAPHVRIEATGSGYAVTAPSLAAAASAAEVGDLVTAARRT